MNALEIYRAWKPFIDKACDLHKAVKKDTLCGLFEHESEGNPTAVGDGGMARGLGQMHEAACKTIGADWGRMFYPADAIAASAAYLAFCIQHLGSEFLGLMAYNQGPTVIGRAAGYARIVGENASAQSWTASITPTQS